MLYSPAFKIFFCALLNCLFACTTFAAVGEGGIDGSSPKSPISPERDTTKMRLFPSPQGKITSSTECDETGAAKKEDEDKEAQGTALPPLLDYFGFIGSPEFQAQLAPYLQKLATSPIAPILERLLDDGFDKYTAYCAKYLPKGIPISPLQKVYLREIKDSGSCAAFPPQGSFKEQADTKPLHVKLDLNLTEKGGWIDWRAIPLRRKTPCIARFDTTLGAFQVGGVVTPMVTLLIHELIHIIHYLHSPDKFRKDRSDINSEKLNITPARAEDVYCNHEEFRTVQGTPSNKREYESMPLCDLVTENVLRALLGLPQRYLYQEKESHFLEDPKHVIATTLDTINRIKLLLSKFTTLTVHPILGRALAEVEADMRILDQTVFPEEAAAERGEGIPVEDEREGNIAKKDSQNHGKKATLTPKEDKIIQIIAKFIACFNQNAVFSPDKQVEKLYASAFKPYEAVEQADKPQAPASYVAEVDMSPTSAPKKQPFKLSPGFGQRPAAAMRGAGGKPTPKPAHKRELRTLFSDRTNAATQPSAGSDEEI